MSNKIKILLSVFCLILAVGIAYVFMFGGSDAASMIWFTCNNPKCKATYSLKPDEFAKLTNGDPMSIMPGQAVKCNKCGLNTAYMAQKCFKCGKIFLINMRVPATRSDYPDKCPNCGYSSMEQMDKKRSKEISINVKFVTL